MLLVVDTSALVAVLVSEPQRSALVHATRGAELVAPASVHWEVGNAMTALMKRRRINLSRARKALTAYAAIPIRQVDVDLVMSIELAAKHDLYAYDAYLISCALTMGAPLLTLDRGLERAAAEAGAQIFEVPA
ncbi:MAG: type II toxin-antitoxin system VapC family toxin [Deltaproteobacteria bacterium]|nr:type II toxin-antitoxin system VapC family toxin [Deltaproteobacteria bacterium]